MTNCAVLSRESRATRVSRNGLGDWWSWEQRSFTSHFAHRHLPNLSWNSWCWIIFLSSGALSLSPPPAMMARSVRCNWISLSRPYLCFFPPLNRLRACWLLSWIQQRISRITCLGRSERKIINYERSSGPGGAHHRSIVRKINAVTRCCLLPDKEKFQQEQQQHDLNVPYLVQQRYTSCRMMCRRLALHKRAT